MDLTQMRNRVRTDLHDEDSQTYRWTDAELDRHIDHALREFSIAQPREQTVVLSTTAGSRDLSLSSLTDLVQVEAAEFPKDKYPPIYVQFSIWESTLTMLVDQAPGAAEEVKVFYGKLHTLDATTSTIPPQMEDLVAAGSAGYAAVEWSSFATNRVNVGGSDTWRQYLTWGQQRLAYFHQRLVKLSRKGSLRARRLYTPARGKPSQTQVTGP